MSTLKSAAPVSARLCCYSRTEGSTDNNIIIQIHENCLTRVDITGHPVRVAVAVKSATTAVAAAGVGVGVGVGVGLGLGVAVGVELGRGVAVGVELGRGVAVGVAVGDALTTVTVPTMLQHPPCGMQ